MWHIALVLALGFFLGTAHADCWRLPNGQVVDQKNEPAKGAQRVQCPAAANQGAQAAQQRAQQEAQRRQQQAQQEAQRRQQQVQQQAQQRQQQAQQQAQQRAQQQAQQRQQQAKPHFQQPEHQLQSQQQARQRQPQVVQTQQQPQQRAQNQERAKEPLLVTFPYGSKVSCPQVPIGNGAARCQDGTTEQQQRAVLKELTGKTPEQYLQSQRQASMQQGTTEDCIGGYSMQNGRWVCMSTGAVSSLQAPVQMQQQQQAQQKAVAGPAQSTQAQMDQQARQAQLKVQQDQAAATLKNQQEIAAATKKAQEDQQRWQAEAQKAQQISQQQAQQKAQQELAAATLKNQQEIAAATKKAQEDQQRWQAEAQKAQQSWQQNAPKTQYTTYGNAPPPQNATYGNAPPPQNVTYGNSAPAKYTSYGNSPPVQYSSYGNSQTGQNTNSGTQSPSVKANSAQQPVIANQPKPSLDGLQDSPLKRDLVFLTSTPSEPFKFIPCVPMPGQDCAKNDPIFTVKGSIAAAWHDTKIVLAECKKAIGECIDIGGAMIGAAELSSIQKAALSQAKVDKNKLVLVFQSKKDFDYFKSVKTIYLIPFPTK